jgi:hypothetical protein
MFRSTLLVFACLALLATINAQESCDNLKCDPCPTYRDANGFVQVKQTSSCVVTDVRPVLTCNCEDPPAGALLAGRDAPADSGGNTNDAGNGGADDINTLPPDGGSGSVIPTQSYGTPAANASKTSPILFLATAAAFAVVAMLA